MSVKLVYCSVYLVSQHLTVFCSGYRRPFIELLYLLYLSYYIIILFILYIFFLEATKWTGWKNKMQDVLVAPLFYLASLDEAYVSAGEYHLRNRWLNRLGRWTRPTLSQFCSMRKRSWTTYNLPIPWSWGSKFVKWPIGKALIPQSVWSVILLLVAWSF